MKKNWKSLGALYPFTKPRLKSQLGCVSIFETCVENNNKTHMKLCSVNQNDPQCGSF